MRCFGFNEPSFNVKRLGFAFSRFTPADLFAKGEQGVWLDPSDLSTMFQDVDGLEPVTKDGDPVALIRDKSGNNNHATQSTATARPIYRNEGELHYLEFDGVDDYLILPHTWITYINGFASVKNYVRDTLFTFTYGKFRYGIRNYPDSFPNLVSGNYNGRTYIDLKGVHLDLQDGTFIEFENDSKGYNDLKVNGQDGMETSVSPSTSVNNGCFIGNMTNKSIDVFGSFLLNEFILLNRFIEQGDRDFISEYFNNKRGFKNE